ncbi:MAG: class I SAM-dependent methyltransferase [Actinobacteria bacterium]|nr:class I SAM-dependent methyltransferase [Actinomycetota bacterium]
MTADSNPAVAYGPDAPTEQELRLLGELKGKRVLELGCGAGGAAVAFARNGASVTAVDASAAHLKTARALADRAEVRVEWHEGDVADLAFLRADSVDLVFSAHTVGEVDDIGRVFRQVHRVLRPHGAFVFSYDHPLALCVARETSGGAAADQPPELPLGGVELRRSYFDDTPVMLDGSEGAVKLYPRTISSVSMGLNRAGFRVEVLLEPAPPGAQAGQLLVPPTIVWRARKEGA